MDQKNNVATDDLLWGACLLLLGGATAIGASALTGGILGSFKLTTGPAILTKVCVPLGIAGMSAAVGVAASDAMKQKANDIKENVEIFGEVLNSLSTQKKEETTEENQADPIDEQATQLDN